jgi:hypothetical protein
MTGNGSPQDNGALASLLYEVASTDLQTFALTAALLTVTAVNRNRPLLSVP